MKFLFLVFCIATIVIATRIKKFAPYSYTGNYKINGTVQSQSFIGGNITSDPITTIFNSDKKRLYSGYQLGNATFLVFENISYVYGNLFGGACFWINFTYDQEIAAYSQARHFASTIVEVDDYDDDYDDQRIDFWGGSINEAASCNVRLNAVFQTRPGNILIQESYELDQPTTTDCVRPYYIVKNNINTIRGVSDVESFFTIPPQCYPPFVLSFCEKVYPINNPCISKT